MATVEGERSESTGLGTSSRAVTGEAPTLFARKATGLVRDWSIRDSFIFALASGSVSCVSPTLV